MPEVSGDFLAMSVFFYAMHCLHELGPAELVGAHSRRGATGCRGVLRDGMGSAVGGSLGESFRRTLYKYLLFGTRACMSIFLLCVLESNFACHLCVGLCVSRTLYKYILFSTRVCMSMFLLCVLSQISYIPNVSVSRASHSGCLRVPILVSSTCFRSRARLVCRLLETIGSQCPCLESLFDIVFDFVLTLRFLPAISPVSGASRKSEKNIRGIYSTLSIYCIFRCFTSVHTPHHFVTATVGWDLQANHVARGSRPPLRGGRVHDDSPPRRLRLPGTF